MEKNAIITVKSFSDLDANEVIEVVTPGKFIIHDGYYEATYEESKLSGMEGTTTNLTIYDDKLILERIGSTETKMEFKEKEVNVSLYNTPYGMLHLTIDTIKLDIDINDNGGKINAKYLLGAEGQPGITTELTVGVKLKK